MAEQENVIRIKANDVCAKDRHPEDILSNLCGNDFCFDDVQCGCMESFLQSLKFQDEKLQREICLSKADGLYRYSKLDRRDSQPLWWKGRLINRHSPEFTQLLREAYKAMFIWCRRFRDALMSTLGMELVYDSGLNNPNQTILTDQEFCTILTELREEYRDGKYHYPKMWPNSYGVEEDYDWCDSTIIRKTI